MAESYYAERAARDPEWRRQAIAGALERERARRERDPEAFRARRREATARTRARQVAHGLTFTELLRRSPVADRVSLTTVMNDLVRSGLVDFHSSSQRYELNGGLPADVRLALRDLEL